MGGTAVSMDIETDATIASLGTVAEHLFGAEHVDQFVDGNGMCRVYVGQFECYSKEAAAGGVVMVLGTPESPEMPRSYMRNVGATARTMVRWYLRSSESAGSVGPVGCVHEKAFDMVTVAICAQGAAAGFGAKFPGCVCHWRPDTLEMAVVRDSVPIAALEFNGDVGPRISWYRDDEWGTWLHCLSYTNVGSVIAMGVV